MGKIEELAEKYSRHISLPWQQTISGAQRIIIVIYDKELERTLRARKNAFENATKEAGHKWLEVDITNAFASWIAADEYREAYFEAPEDLKLKLEAEFAQHVADQISAALTLPEADASSVVAVLGAGSLFGLTRVSQVLKLIEHKIKGRVVVFFPGQFEDNNYRLLDARDGWNYMAIPISLHGGGA
jgi:hypothetical protein